MKSLLQIILSPISLLYGITILVRNKLYDWKVTSQTSFKVPTIAIGNLSVGGSGKTPLTEYLIRLLSNLELTTLSRGYKRKTSGFILASKTSTSQEIGDEPLQLYQKFNSINVAVCEDRVKGATEILKLKPNTKVILLDDAFQHRAIKPGLNILVTDFNNIFTNDYLMPSGRLREWREGYKRADIIIVSKTPINTNKNTLKKIAKDINPKAYQKLYFSNIKYSESKHYENSKKLDKTLVSKETDALLISGIAKPLPLLNHIKNEYKSVGHIKFPDHHDFTKTDVEKIKNRFVNINSDNKIIITTEKDIMRLSLPEILKDIQDIPIYYVPIKIDFFSSEDKANFDKQILDYVSSNTGN
ncbi:MAG: tetraacyldisaccharide 4'-kinase [Vicingaceae bacterium]|nr:tetraacyldisaccharide 4'-kinase [Vicingaceae bacterium]